MLSLGWPLDTQVVMSSWQLKMCGYRWPGDEVWKLGASLWLAPEAMGVDTLTGREALDL